MSKIVENYKLHEVLGEGSFGKVYRGLHMKTNQEFAIKQVRNSIFDDNPKFKEFMLNEIKTLSQINSENVVRFIELLKSANNAYFVYEFCNGGTLDALIKKSGRFSEQEALQIFHQIVSGFKELVKLNVLHRDLKPQNIFLNNKVVKLGDFGFCKQLQGKEEMARTMLGSPIYMAPEILNGYEYTMKADIWSLGVVLYEMLYGICPFNARTIVQLARQIELTEIRYPPQIQFSTKTKSLLEKMLVKKEKQRISWEELFELEKQIYSSLNQEPTNQNQQQQSPQSQQSSQQTLQQQNQQTYVYYRKDQSNSPQIQQQSPPKQITQQQQVIINQQMKVQNPQLIPMKRDFSSQKELEEESKGTPTKPLPNIPQKQPVKQNTLLWFYPISNQSFSTKCEFYNFLLGERNKIVFLIKILFKCHTENKKQLQSSLGILAQLFCFKMNSELLEKQNIVQQKSNVEFSFAGNSDSYFSSYEFKKIQEITQLEIKEFLESCLQQSEQQNYLTYDILSIIKNIIKILETNYGNLKNFQNDEQLIKKELIFLNQLLDCLLIDELFLNFIDLANANLEEQEYFKQIDNCELSLLEQIVQHKIAYAKAKFLKNVNS